MKSSSHGLRGRHTAFYNDALATNDSTAFERSELNKYLAAFCNCIGTDFGGNFVPAKFAILPADQVENLFTE